MWFIILRLQRAYIHFEIHLHAFFWTKTLYPHISSYFNLLLVIKNYITRYRHCNSRQTLPIYKITMHVMKRLDPDVFFEFLERIKSKVPYMFKIFPSNQTSLELSSISVIERIALEEMLLLIVAMTLQKNILTAKNKQNRQQNNAHNSSL